MSTRTHEQSSVHRVFSRAARVGSRMEWWLDGRSGAGRDSAGAIVFVHAVAVAVGTGGSAAVVGSVGRGELRGLRPWLGQLRRFVAVSFSF